jgi:hypothetical protein
MTQKPIFRVFDLSMQSHFNHASLLQAPQHLKQISTPLFEAISGLFNHLNVTS